jgi:hypothetical protein
MRPLSLRFVALFVVPSFATHALAADYVPVTGISAEAVIIPASAAEREKIWPRKDTRYWTPTFSDVQTVEAQLSPFFKAEEIRNREFRGHIAEIQKGLRKSRRQYVGLVIHGEKQILVNAFPKDQTLPWKRQFIEVSDGGARYWSVRYDLKLRAFQNLLFNGPG